MQKQPFENNSQYSQGNTCYWSLFFNKVAVLQLFSWEYCKIFRSAFYRTPPVAASVHYIFKKTLLHILSLYIAHFALKPKITLIRFHSWCRSLPFVLPLSVIRCHSLSLVVLLVVLLVVIRRITCCHSFSLVVIRCYSLSLVCLFINDHFSSGVTRFSL